VPILNYTTKIRPDRTVAEIQNILAAKGARRIAIDYADGKISAVVFSLDIAGKSAEFRLPARPDGVLAALRKQRVPSTYQTREHAESVAWRIVKDWVSAQLALVEAQQAEMAEVFLPYVIVRKPTDTEQDMTNIVKLREARAAANADSTPFQDMPRAYRWPAMYHRAMMVAFFWHDGLFEHHATEFAQYIEWAFLDKRRR
jgi:hypothetical protein